MPAAASTSASRAEASARREPVGTAIALDIVRGPPPLEPECPSERFLSWPPMTRSPLLLACLLLALLAAGCGGDDEKEASAPSPTATAAPAAPGGSVEAVAISKD